MAINGAIAMIAAFAPQNEVEAALALQAANSSRDAALVQASSTISRNAGKSWPMRFRRCWAMVSKLWTRLATPLYLLACNPSMTA
jgi:hypothetical protein